MCVCVCVCVCVQTDRQTDRQTERERERERARERERDGSFSWYVFLLLLLLECVTLKKQNLDFFQSKIKKPGDDWLQAHCA